MITDDEPNPYAPPRSIDLPPPPGRPILGWLTFGRGLALVFLALLLVTVSHVLFVEEMRLKRRSGVVQAMDLAALAAFLLGLFGMFRSRWPNEPRRPAFELPPRTRAAESNPPESENSVP